MLNKVWTQYEKQEVRSKLNLAIRHGSFELLAQVGVDLKEAPDIYAKILGFFNTLPGYEQHLSKLNHLLGIGSGLHEPWGSRISNLLPVPKPFGGCTVINLNDPDGPGVVGWFQRPDIIYVGISSKRYSIPQSPLHNPYKIKGKTSRSDACQMYRENKLWPSLESREGHIWDEINKLANQVAIGHHLRLACWCTPLECHASDIAVAIESEAINIQKGQSH